MKPRIIRSLPQNHTLTRDQLHRLFDLNRRTGELIWKRPTGPGPKPGDIAGRRHVGSGRIIIRIRGKDYGRGALVYQYCFGGPLPSEVRHLNEIITDDRPENLRPITTYPGTELTQAYLRKAFYLDYKTGQLFRWIETQGRLTLENRPAGTLGDSGRWEIYVLGHVMRRHQLVYLYVHGGKIPEQLNHINGDLTDDRPSNLRPAPKDG